MIDINDDAQCVRGRVEVRSGIVRRRRWTAQEKGRIVAEAVVPGAVIAGVARRHDLTPQHLSNWIRAAKEGRIALPADEGLRFVPLIASDTICGAPASPPQERSMPIEIAVGPILVRVANGADSSTLEAVMRAVRRAAS